MNHGQVKEIFGWLPANRPIFVLLFKKTSEQKLLDLVSNVAKCMNKISIFSSQNCYICFWLINRRVSTFYSRFLKPRDVSQKP